MTSASAAFPRGDTAIDLIETIRVEAGQHAPLLPGHWRRLEHSCRALGYEWPQPELRHAVQERIDTLDSRYVHRLRLLVGPNRRYSLESTVLPPTPVPVQLWLAPTPLQADPFWLQHKTTHRPWYEQDKIWLDQHPDFFDVLHCNAHDEVCEGSRSNIYIQDAAGRWLTPPPKAGLLPGVQRQALVDAGIVIEACIRRHDLLHAPAIRVSNALRGWLDATLGAPSYAGRPT
jgi:4-amino-4-deoxychorismate lyase